MNLKMSVLRITHLMVCVLAVAWRFTQQQREGNVMSLGSIVPMMNHANGHLFRYWIADMRKTHYMRLWLGLEGQTIAQVINRDEFMALKGSTSQDEWNCNYLNGKTATVITCAIGWEVTRSQAVKMATDYILGRTVTHHVDLRDCGMADLRLKKPPVTNRGVTES